ICEKDKLPELEQQRQEINKTIYQLNDTLLVNDVSLENQASVGIIDQLKKILNKINLAEEEQVLDKIKKIN
ncbi:hypothetical protein KKC67_01445, partial [Patescibacteria group bacterium]|nr:hypothetical protein [Patescibacteria group bacterium]